MKTSLVQPKARISAVNAAPPAPARSHAYLMWCVCALLFAQTAAMGGVRPDAIFAMQCGAALLLAAWAVFILRAKKTVTLDSAMLLAVGLMLIAAGQLVFGKTAYSYATRSELLLWLAYGAIFFVSYQCFLKAENLPRFLWTIAGFGLVLSVFAIIQHLTSDALIYWTIKPRFGNAVFGPYINRNHYAGMMEMLIACPLAMVFHGRISRAQRFLLAFTATIMGGSILLSGSRGGMLSLVIQLALLAILLLKRNRRASIGVAAFVALVTLFLLQFDRGAVMSRLMELQEAGSRDISGSRLDIFKDTLSMIAARPIFGWGLGAFPIVFPQFRTFYGKLYVNAAHNDYLQLAAEVGLVGLVLGLALAASFLMSGFRAFKKHDRDMTGTASLAAVVGITGLLVHSLTDFNFHIPANAAMFAVFGALALAVKSCGAPPAADQFLRNGSRTIQ